MRSIMFLIITLIYCLAYLVYFIRVLGFCLIGEGREKKRYSNKPTIPYLPMEFPSPPSRKDRVSMPEGVHVKMCLCGTPCRLMRSTDSGYTYGRRYWMCANYEYDPSQHRSSSNRRRVILTFRLLYKISF